MLDIEATCRYYGRDVRWFQFTPLPPELQHNVILTRKAKGIRGGEQVLQYTSYRLTPR